MIGSTLTHAQGGLKSVCDTISIPSTVSIGNCGDPMVHGDYIIGPFGKNEANIDFNLSVYNRWGEALWQSTNPENQWDFIYKNTLLQAGTYFYKCSFVCDGEETSLSGNITLIR